MGKALSYAVREKIVLRRKQGQSYVRIAADLGCSESGVKKIWYAYQKQGDSALLNAYSNCGRQSPFSPAVHIAIDSIRDNGQGAPYVYSKLSKDYPDLLIPKARTLNRWWKQDGTNRARGRRVGRKKKGGPIKPIILGK